MKLKINQKNRYCEKCGKENREGSKFCHYCGADLSTRSSAIKAPIQKVGWKNPIVILLVALILLGGFSFGGYKTYAYYQVQSKINSAKKLQGAGDFNGSLSVISNLGGYSPAAGQQNTINAVKADDQKFLTFKASFDAAVALENSSSSDDLQTALKDLQSIDASYPAYKGVQAEVTKVQNLLVTTLQENAQKAQSEAASAAQTATEQLSEADKKQKIEELLTIGNLLQDYYKEIRDANISFGGVNRLFLWLNIGASQYDTNFMSDLAKHDLGEPYSSAYHTPYWSAQESTYHSQTQNGTYSYQDAKKILDNAVVYAAGVNYYKDSDYEKIRKILNFMHSYLHYENDFNDTLRAPVETLGLKSGDCDDWATLASAAFADAGINSAIITVKSKDLTELHVMVLVQSKENLPIYSYSDLTQFGLPSGKWWVIEPQYTLEQQNPEWLAKWNIDSAALVKSPY